MNAMKKGCIGIAVGGIACSIAFFCAGASSPQGLGFGDVVGCLLGGLLVGGFFGFGYAFGWRFAKSWLAKALGVAAVGSFASILFSRDRRSGFMGAFIITTICLSCALGLAYLPGIFVGVRDIIREHRGGVRTDA